MQDYTPQSVYSWWSDRNSTGATINLHTAAKPLMWIMYQRQARALIKRERRVLLSARLMDDFEGYICYKHVPAKAKEQILEDLIRRSTTRTDAYFLVSRIAQHPAAILPTLLAHPVTSLRNRACRLMESLAKELPGEMHTAMDWKQLVHLLADADAKICAIAVHALAHIAPFADGETLAILSDAANELKASTRNPDVDYRWRDEEFRLWAPTFVHHTIRNAENRRQSRAARVSNWATRVNSEEGLEDPWAPPTPRVSTVGGSAGANTALERRSSRANAAPQRRSSRARRRFPATRPTQAEPPPPPPPPAVERPTVRFDMRAPQRPRPSRLDLATIREIDGDADPSPPYEPRAPLPQATTTHIPFPEGVWDATNAFNLDVPNSPWIDPHYLPLQPPPGPTVPWAAPVFYASQFNYPPPTPGPTSPNPNPPLQGLPPTAEMPLVCKVCFYGTNLCVNGLCAAHCPHPHEHLSAWGPEGMRWRFT
ncbi:hypothetical protein MKEN_01116100 [Mycena kentingensis (nom. inval.)]|nr:hypothetical protein MKEN_01116100 [Mycena kentingensis (nom. inval.)]